MSFMLKLEHIYGNFIRLLTALLTLTLLAVAVVALVNWQRATTSEDSRKDAAQGVPRVSSADLVKRVVASQTGQSVDPIISHDPNRASFERIEKAVRAFAQKYPSEQMDVASLLSLAHEKADGQDTGTLKAAYASGLADALEHTLTDAKVEALLKSPGEGMDIAQRPDGTPVRIYDNHMEPASIVHETMDQYDSDFTAQIAMNVDDASTDANNQRDAWTSLARMGGPLLLIILVLQLLTFGRIEQNTRSLGSTK